MSPKKFIMLVNCYPHPFHVKKEEDYFLIPCSVMSKKGFGCEYVTLRAQGSRTIETKFAKDSAYEEYYEGFKIRRFDKTTQLLSYIRKERAILQSNLRPWLPSTLSAFLPNTKVMRSFTYFMGSNMPIAFFSAFAFRFFDRILAVTPYEMDVYRKYKLPEKKLRLIPFAIDYSFFSKKVPADDFKEKFGIKEQDKLIVAAANVRKLKRFDVLIKALPLVKEEIPSAKAVIVGADLLHAQGLPSIKELAEKYGVSGSVVLAGHNDAEGVRKFYSMSHVFCHPAADEYQGLVSYEAAAMGLPLCLSTIGSHTSVYKEHALYHDVGDYEKLAKDIIYSIKHRDEREEHIRFLKEHMKEWDEKLIFKKTSDFYDELIESKKLKF
ncbi:MAG: glycosyltransferase family 4 protein [Candidatus Woesearchaeota archaeon]